MEQKERGQKKNDTMDNGGEILALDHGAVTLGP